LIRISPISHTRLAAFHSEKISAEPQKEAAQKDERNAPILIKTKHRVVATFAELLKNCLRLLQNLFALYAKNNLRKAQILKFFNYF